MQFELGSDSVDIKTIETEEMKGISSTINRSKASLAIDSIGNGMDNVTISDEALLLAATIVPSLEEQENDARFNMLIATQGGLVGPGGAMINIASIESPVYAMVKNGSITISGMDFYSYQNAFEIRHSTIKMLEYVQLLTQEVKIEEGHSLQEKLMIMVDSLANVQEELVGDPNYNQDSKSVEEAFRNITSILIADSARVEYSDMPDNDQMIFEARSMADMFNNLLFESLTKYDPKEAFEKAWSAI